MLMVMVMMRKTVKTSVNKSFTGTDIFRWVYGLRHGRVLWQVYRSSSYMYCILKFNCLIYVLIHISHWSIFNFQRHLHFPLPCRHLLACCLYKVSIGIIIVKESIMKPNTIYVRTNNAISDISPPFCTSVWCYHH